MARPRNPGPTERELAILQVLWECGDCTVRQIQDKLQSGRNSNSTTGYTTTLKIMQIMLEKKLLKRDESGHAHVYRAAVTRDRTQRKIVGRMLDQVFGGSAQRLVLHALSARKSTPEELAEIRALLDEIEGDNQ